MRVAQISDFHYTYVPKNPLRWCCKRFFGILNWLLHRKKNFSSDSLQQLPALLSELKVDWVFLGGDFTSSALLEEYEQALGFVRSLKMPWIALPGNHDLYTYRSQREKRFYRYLRNQMSDELATKGVEVHHIGPHLWVVALDTARATHIASSRGLFRKTQEAHLEKALAQIPEKDRIILFNHYPFFSHDAPKRRLERAEALEAIVRRDPKICLYLHGHTHSRIVADLQPSGLPVVLDGGSVATKRGTWNLIDLDERGCIVTTYEWKESWSASHQETIAWKR